MKKVFLEELPKSKNGKLIDWINCLGYKVKFIYKDIEDYVEIIDYYISDNGKPYLIIKYKERIKPISTDSLKKGSLGNILMKNTSDFKYEIGTTFKEDKRDITIVDRKYMK